MNANDENKEGVKVNDKRRFDSEGNEKSAEEPATRGEGAPGGQHDSAPEITFGSFIMSLATQALMQLGEIPPPPGMDLPVYREGAKQTIDVIAMLERKVKGNVDSEEQQLLTEVLHNLRMCYVRKG